MGQVSTIEWTDASWNCVRGCSRVSEGCRNCYAERIASRFSGAGNSFHGFAIVNGNGPHWTGKVELIPEMLELPLRWKKPRRIFVNSMSDLFHEALPDADIDRVFAVGLVACERGHILQILTKRAERMREYWEADPLPRILTIVEQQKYPLRDWPEHRLAMFHGGMWLGVSVEDQATADERIPLLLRTPVAVRFISAEPLLGPVDLVHLCGNTFDALSGRNFDRLDVDDTPGLNWVIVGGESGPGARPMHPDWARSIRDQCVAAHVPFFFKQWGEYGPTYSRSGYAPVSHSEPRSAYSWGYKVYSPRLGKKAAGRLLDGRTWDELPEVR